MADEHNNHDDHTEKPTIDFSKLSFSERQEHLRSIKNQYVSAIRDLLKEQSAKFGKDVADEIHDAVHEEFAKEHNRRQTGNKANDSESAASNEEAPEEPHASTSRSRASYDPERPLTDDEIAKKFKNETLANRALKQQEKINLQKHKDGLKGNVTSSDGRKLVSNIDRMFGQLENASVALLKDLRSQVADHQKVLNANYKDGSEKKWIDAHLASFVRELHTEEKKRASFMHNFFSGISKTHGINAASVASAAFGNAPFWTRTFHSLFNGDKDDQKRIKLQQLKAKWGLPRYDNELKAPEPPAEETRLHDEKTLGYLGGLKSNKERREHLDYLEQNNKATPEALKRERKKYAWEASEDAEQPNQPKGGSGSKGPKPGTAKRKRPTDSDLHAAIDRWKDHDPTQQEIELVQDGLAYHTHKKLYGSLDPAQRDGVNKQVRGLQFAKNLKENPDAPRPLDRDKPSNPPVPERPKEQPPKAEPPKAEPRKPESPKAPASHVPTADAWAESLKRNSSRLAADLKDASGHYAKETDEVLKRQNTKPVPENKAPEPPPAPVEQPTPPAPVPTVAPPAPVPTVAPPAPVPTVGPVTPKRKDTFKVLSIGKSIEDALEDTPATLELAEKTYKRFASDRFKTETVVLLVNGKPVKAVGPRAEAILSKNSKPAQSTAEQSKVTVTEQPKAPVAPEPAPVEPTPADVLPKTTTKKPARKKKPTKQDAAGDGFELTSPVVEPAEIRPAAPAGPTEKPTFGIKEAVKRRRPKKVSENQQAFEFPHPEESLSPERITKTGESAPTSNHSLLKTVGLTAASVLAPEAVPVLEGVAAEGAVAETVAAEGAEAVAAKQAISETRPVRVEPEKKGLTNRVAEALEPSHEPHAEVKHESTDSLEEVHENSAPKKTHDAKSEPAIAPERINSGDTGHFSKVGRVVADPTSPTRADAAIEKALAVLHTDQVRLEKISAAQLEQLHKIVGALAREDEEERLAADAERRKVHETELPWGKKGSEVKSKGGGLLSGLLGFGIEALMGGFFGKAIGKFLPGFGNKDKSGPGMWSHIKSKFGFGKAAEAGTEATSVAEGAAKTASTGSKLITGGETATSVIKVVEGVSEIGESVGILGKIGSVLGKFSGVTKLLRLGGNVVGKFLWPLQIIMSVIDFFSGFMNAGKILGKKGKLDMIDKISGGVGGVVKGLVGIVDMLLGFIGIKSNLGGFVGKQVGRIFDVVLKTAKIALSPFIMGWKIFTKIINAIPWAKIFSMGMIFFDPLEKLVDNLSGIIDNFESAVDWLFGEDDSKNPFDKASSALNAIKEFLEKLSLLNPLNWGGKAVKAAGGAISGAAHSVGGAISGVGHAIMHPLDTAGDAQARQAGKDNRDKGRSLSRQMGNSPSDSTSPAKDTTSEGGEDNNTRSNSQHKTKPAEMSLGDRIGSWWNGITGNTDGVNAKRESGSSSPARGGGSAPDGVSVPSRISGDGAADIYARYGQSSAFRESRGDAGAVNVRNAAKDPGGFSYGLYQMTTRTSNNATGGTMKGFMEHLSKSNPDAYQKLQDAGGINAAIDGDPKFIQAFKQLSSDPKFVNEQHVFIGKNNYDPVAKAAEKAGIDLSKRGDGVKQLLFSTGVNGGAGMGQSLMRNAFKGMTPDQIGGLSDEDLIKQVQGYKADHVRDYYPTLAKNNPAQLETLRNRFLDETNDFLNPDQQLHQTLASARGRKSDSPTPLMAENRPPSTVERVTQAAGDASSMGGHVTAQVAPIGRERRGAAPVQGDINPAYYAMGMRQNLSEFLGGGHNPYVQAEEKAREQENSVTSKNIVPQPGSIDPSVSGARLRKVSDENSTIKSEAVKTSVGKALIHAPKSTNVVSNTTNVRSTPNANSSEDTYERQMNRVWVLT
jgi:hypothetical protein